MVNSYYSNTLTQYNCTVREIKIDQPISGGLNSQQIESRLAETQLLKCVISLRFLRAEAEISFYVH